ncbi:MAG: cyclic nucleotide-binding domain-containing protein [Gammaproteobacteria bacterium]|nr:cyclic nucleotide-binding domain-containing protein [Gammaproteobacteria bacterium]
MTETEANIALLRSVPIFSSLTDRQLQHILESPDNGIVEFGPLEDIIHENEIGDCMYIILTGVVDVRMRTVGGRDITIATLKPNEFFGEQALLPGSTGQRNATVRALKPCRLLRISKSDVVLGLSHEEPDAPLPRTFENTSDQDRVRMLLRGVRLFRALSRKDLARVHEWTKVVSFEAGNLILREREAGDYMYVVLDGSVDVFVIDDDGKVVILAQLTRGHYFGEQALLPGVPGERNANVRANTAVTLVRVAKKYFQLILNHDNKLTLALREAGAEQRKKIQQAIGRQDPF